MNLASRIQQFLRSSDGFAVSSELMLWASIAVIAMTVGIIAVRVAVLGVYIDAGEALAARESGFTFDDSDLRLFFKQPTTMNFFDENPEVGTDAGPIVTGGVQIEGS